MTEICSLDSDECLSLDLISQALRCGIKEEHSWALLYQSVISLEEYLKQNDVNCEPSESKLFIRSDGYIDHKSWHCLSSLSSNADFSQIISFIASDVYKALDYGVPEDEEIELPSDLEQLFIFMSEKQNTDEGIEDSDVLELMSVLKIVKEKCSSRVMSSLNVGDHYRNVCRALVAEAIEMSTFLNQISKGTKELKNIKNVSNEEVDEIHVELWAHLWMKVMKQLRSGVSLKSVDSKEFLNNAQKDYELTPFEMLLNDINTKSYLLKKVTISKEVVKDARTTILEFIRSRPPLKPASERVLGPPRIVEPPSLHQKLMDGIKQTQNLKPAPKTFERKFDSYHMPRGKKLTAFSIYSKSVVIGARPIPVLNRGRSDSVFERLSFRNLSLRRTFSTISLNRKLVESVMTVEETPTETTPTTSKVPFWRKLFNW